MVTGGAGFIGSNVAAALEERHQGKVVICDRLGDGDKRLNIAKRDLADVIGPEDLLTFLDDNGSAIKAVVHMGAISSTTAKASSRIVDTNYRLPLRLWRWCADRRVPFIYASSAATYGDGSQGFADDGSPDALSRLRPLNAYGRSKHLFDRRVARMVRDGKPSPPQWAGLKFFNVYGPNEYHKGAQKSVAAQLFAQVREGGPARLFASHNADYPDGGQMRDFVWVGDCVGVIVWLLENEGVSGLYNCGSGRARTFEDVARSVFAALGREPEIEFIPMPDAIRDCYQYFTEADMGRLAGAGYAKPFTSLEDGVGRYVSGYLDASDPYV